MGKTANWRNLVRFQWTVALFLAFNFATSIAVYGEDSKDSFSLNEKASKILKKLTQEEAQWTQDAIAVENHPPIRSLRVHVSPPRGGFGDVAANVIMAKKLKIERSDVNIRMVFTKTAAPLLKDLLPGFDPSKDVQTVQGIEIYDESDWRWIDPPADADVEFATLSKFSPFSDNETTPIELKYREAVHEALPDSSIKKDSEVDEFDSELRSKSKAVSAFQANQEKPLRGVLQTGVNNGGMYISSQKPPPVFSDREWDSWLRQNLGGDTYELIYGNTHAKPELAFSYTKLPKSSELYLEALSMAARRKPLNQRRIVVFVKDFPKMKIPVLPPNVEVVRLQSMPLDISEALIQRATLPVMVTGDGSLSMAMDHETSFFYEANHWKEGNAEALVDEIVKNSILIRQNPNWNRALHETLKISSTSPELDARRLSEIFLDSNYQSEFRTILGKLRIKESLPRRVFDEAGILAKYGASAKMLLPMIRDGISVETLEDHLRQTIMDVNVPTAHRLETFGTLISLKSWYSNTNRNFYRKLIASKDPILRQPLRTYLAHNFRHEKVMSILIDALSSSDPDLKNSAEAIVRPIAFNPFRSEDPMRRERNNAIRLLSASSLKERQRRLFDCFLNNFWSNLKISEPLDLGR